MATTQELIKAPAAALDKFDKLVQAGNVRTAQEMRERVAEIQEQAFVLTPSYIAQFAQGYQGTPQVVAIDPSVDAESGAGAHVYFQRSIHKSNKVDRPGGGYDYVPTEVSLNKYALLKILEAVGVSVSDPVWTQDGSKEPYLWMCTVGGTVLEFTGERRKLPPGVGSLDARDGSADIGEWTAEAWAENVRVAEEQKKKTAENMRWKIRPETINGWTAERVMGVRKFGRQLAQAKATNALARNLGVKQKYTVDELRRKPFIAVRTVFVPDMSNPEIAKMVTAHHLGALATLYPQAGGAQQLPGATTHAYGEAGQTLPGELVDATVAEPEPAERMQTAPPPQDAAEVAEEAPQPPTGQVLTVTKVLKNKEDQYFVETKEGTTLFFMDTGLLKPVQAAAKDGQPREFSTERVMVKDQPYRQIVEMTAPGGLKY